MNNFLPNNFLTTIRLKATDGILAHFHTYVTCIDAYTCAAILSYSRYYLHAPLVLISRFGHNYWTKKLKKVNFQNFCFKSINYKVSFIYITQLYANQRASASNYFTIVHMAFELNFFLIICKNFILLLKFLHTYERNLWKKAKLHVMVETQLVIMWSSVFKQKIYKPAGCISTKLTTAFYILSYISDPP